MKRISNVVRIVLLGTGWAAVIVTCLGVMNPAAARAAIDTLFSCSSSSPCLEWDNSGTGGGIRGVGINGNGVTGQTRFNSTAPANGKAGVVGNDNSTSGTNDSGVLGKSTQGTGVSATSSNGIAVQAFSSNFIGALITGGLVSQGLGYPALGVVLSPNAGGVGGPDLIDACKGSSFTSLCYNSIAVFQVGENGDITSSGGLFAIGNIFSFSNETVRGSVAVGSATSPVSGDVNISGQYLKNNVCVSGCTLPKSNSPGRAVASYAAQESVPTIEDFGQAQLVNGQAYVPIGADFANVINNRADYMVFITPEGPNRGLYVTRKTIAGFTVMENPDGHSTLAFSYRVVAKPYGPARPRLPMLATQSLRPHRMEKGKTL